MTGIEDLPFEILDRICMYARLSYKAELFDGFDGPVWKQLADLCRTSKRFYRVTLPYLYQSIEFRYTSCSRSNLLNRSILEQPGLGTHIQELNLGSEYNEPDHMKRDEGLEIYFSSLPATGIEGEVVRPDGHITGSNHWYATRALDFLLARLPNLKKLDLIVENKGVGGQGWRYIRENHKDDRAFLNQLRDITLQHWDTEGSLDFDVIVGLLGATKIQKLSIWSCSALEEVTNLRVPSLRELRLPTAALDDEDLTKIVEFFPRLESLRLEQTDWATVADDLEPPVTAQSVSLALLPLRNTLRTLDFQLGDIWEVQAFESLRGLHKLVTLVIELASLGVENKDADEEPSERIFLLKLPSSLECLCISGLKDGIHMAEFLGLGKRSVLPNLKKLIVDGPLGLGSLCMERGIKYREVKPEAFYWSDDNIYGYSQEISEY